MLENAEMRSILECCTAENDIVLVGGGGTGLKTPTLAKARKLLSVRPTVIVLDLNGEELPVLWLALSHGIFATERPTLIFTTNPVAHKAYEPEAFQKLCKALDIEGYEVNRLKSVFVCLPKEPDHEQRAVIHKLLHGGLQKSGHGSSSKAKIAR